MIWQVWWVWAVASLLLAIVEVLAPGYVFLGFAAGAGLTALAFLTGGTLAGWLGASFSLTLLFFASASVLSWLAMRRIAGIRRGQVKVWDRDINED